MDPTTLPVLDGRDFVPFLERNPKIAVRVIEVLCAGAAHQRDGRERRILEYSARPARLLLRLAENYGEVTEDGVRINLKISQQDL